MIPANPVAEQINFTFVVREGVTLNLGDIPLLLPLPVLRERVGVRVSHVIRGKKRTLTLSLSRSTGRGDMMAVCQE
jgi:hypothetical protein